LVVILATGYGDALPALRSIGVFEGQVLIDITNPLTDDFTSLTVGHHTSGAEEIARAMPGAHVAKAFNTLFAQVIADGPKFASGQKAPVFYASDSSRAKKTVKSLIESIGFEPVDAGGLRNSRYLEPIAGLNIYFGYGAGRGTSIAPAWIAKAA
jgi:predicted dinucleotide-binding enzyme